MFHQIEWRRGEYEECESQMGMADFETWEGDFPPGTWKAHVEQGELISPKYP
jgi:hypothetical protein